MLAHQELNEEDEKITYFTRSASAWIHKDCYFNNSTILRQFKRLFKLSKFKRAYESKQLQILVDNATTHSTRHYDVQNFSKKAGTHCPYDTIEWVEDEKKRVVSCKDENGVYVGFLVILKELGLVDPSAKEKQFKLNQIRELLAGQVAFEPITKLEKLAREYDISIVFCP